MDFNEWFDTSNINHIRAFEQMQIQGEWPMDTLPNGIIFKQGWFNIASYQIVDAYIDYMNTLCA